MQLKNYIGEYNLEESAGLQTTVAIADYYEIESFPTMPDLETATDNSDYVTLTGPFVMKTGKQFHEFHATLEGNSFSSNLVGPKGALSHENILTITRHAVNAELLGWLRANKNRHLIVAFKMLGAANYCVIGWQDLWAMVEGAEIAIAAEVSGDKKTATRIRSIFYPPLYIDAIPLTPAV